MLFRSASGVVVTGAGVAAAGVLAGLFEFELSAGLDSQAESAKDNSVIARIFFIVSSVSFGSLEGERLSSPVNGGAQQNVSCAMKKYLGSEQTIVSLSLWERAGVRVRSLRWKHSLEMTGARLRLALRKTKRLRHRKPLTLTLSQRERERISHLLLFGGEIIGQVKLQRAFLNFRADVFNIGFDCAAAGLNRERERKL